MNTTHSSATDLAAKHFARRITARLNEGAANLPYDISERLRAALEAAGLARQIGVEVGVVSDSPARRNAAAAAERLRQAEEIVQNDTFVRSMVHDFGAKIVPGSIQPL